MLSMACGQCWRDAMTISLETGIQNFALAMAVSALSVEESDPSWKDASRIPILCTALYPIHSAWMVLVLRRYPPAPHTGVEGTPPGGGGEAVGIPSI